MERIDREVIDKMLDVGAEEMIKAWKTEIKKRGYVDTGEMIDNIGVTKETKKGNMRVVYPQGQVVRVFKKTGKKQVVRNADKAFMLHYGTSKKLGSHFVDNVVTTSEVKAYLAMDKIFNKYLEERGLI